MRKQNLLKLLLPIGFLLIICSFIIGHFTKLPQPLEGFFKGMGITFIVAYFLKASLTKTV